MTIRRSPSDGQSQNPNSPQLYNAFSLADGLFWPIRFGGKIVSNGNNCNVKPDWPESPLRTVVKSNQIKQNHPANQGNPLYNWVMGILPVNL